jgi:mitochondrial genome maintenance exonuclease 1
VLEIWKSVEPLLENFQTPGMFIEQELTHPYLCYKGIVDCVSFHKDTLCVIEWKKSDRPKKSLTFTYDAPVQLCSYLGALNASKPELKKNPIKSGVVVVAYNDGQKADVFELNEIELRKYWRLWLNRLQDYWVMYKDNTMPEGI